MSELASEDSQDETNPGRKSGPLGLYSGKFFSHSSIFHRPSTALASEDSSINLSQQASFMTDDLDMGADLLDKAVRDVALYNPDEEPDSEFQVSEYMHQIRTENIECEKTPEDDNLNEVTL